MELQLRRRDWDRMRAHVQSQAPLEACGLLAGKADRVEAVLTVANESRSPVRFRMEPAEQLRAFDWIEANGFELVGIFHSHPAGPATVSPTDIAEAAYPVAQLIWSRADGEWIVRGFWIEGQQVSDVLLNVTDDEKP